MCIFMLAPENEAGNIPLILLYPGRVQQEGSAGKENLTEDMTKSAKVKGTVNFLHPVL